VSASGEDDESFVFHGKYHGLLSLEIIYLKFFIAQDQQRWACLFVFSGPVYGAGKVPPRDYFCWPLDFFDCYLT